MTLNEWKSNNRYTVPELAKLSGIKKSKLKRILSSGHCVRLDDAFTIETMTDGQVSARSLMSEGAA